MFRAGLAWMFAMLCVAGAHATAPRVARVGVLTDNPPFSVQRSDGRIEGFAYDLVAAIERDMGLRLERVTGPTNAINEAFRLGRLDMLQSYAQFAEREDIADFSVPYLTLAGSIFVRKGETGIKRLEDLRGRRVMVHAGSLGEQVLRSAGLADSIVIVPSVEESLRRLEAGEGDATLVSRLTAMSLIQQEGLKRVIAVGEPVPGYSVRYCIAVRAGDAELLARINEGLAILQRTGEFDRIYQRWFGHVDPPGYSERDVALVIGGGLTLALAVALWGLRRQGILRRRIAAQAEQLRASEARYRGVFESTLDGLLVISRVPGADGRCDFLVEQANPAAWRVLRQAEPRVGCTLRQLVPMAEPCCERLEAALQQGSSGVSEEWVDVGEARVCLRIAVSRYGGQGLLVLSDITETRVAEEKLRRQEQHLRQAQKLEAIGTLASGIAHDFNNILTAVLGFAEIARGELPPRHPARTAIDEVTRGGRRAAELVRQILTFARHSEARREVLSATPIVKEVLRFLRAAAPSSVEIRHRVVNRSPSIEADPTQLHQALMNLCTNGLHAMRAGGGGVLEVTEEWIQVEPELAALHPPLKAGAYLRLSVRDSGCGMDAATLGHLFEPFFTTKGPGEGTGLGLSVVHGIMQAHGGAVTVYSTPGEGSVFHLFFPAAAERAVPVITEATVAALHGRGERVLLVDDDEQVASVAAGLLRRLGYHVTLFHEPTAVLAALDAEPDAFAVLVCDLTMPHLSGLECIARARASSPQLGVVLMSGYISEPELARARAIPGLRVIDKPLTLQALSHAVADALGAHPPAGSSLASRSTRG